MASPHPAEASHPLRVRRPSTSREWSDGSRSCLYVVPYSAQVLEASVDGVGVFPLRFCCDVLTWAVKQAGPFTLIHS